MKISFEDKSFVSVDSTEKDTVILSVGAKSPIDRLSLIVNSVELTPEQLNELLNVPKKRE